MILDDLPPLVAIAMEHLVPEEDLRPTTEWLPPAAGREVSNPAELMTEDEAIGAVLDMKQLGSMATIETPATHRPRARS
ncbi:MAG: hypothetical protein AAF604_05350 [Acidobacteriota bacterium]